VCIVYTFVFYFLIYGFESFHNSKTRDYKESFMAEIRFQVHFVCMKSLFLGMVHSVFIENNYGQLAGLIVVKLILIALAIRCAQKFIYWRHKSAFIATSLYFFIGIAFDILLILSKMAFNGLISFEKETIDSL